jgi:uncharacterized protein (TIGR03545 family)
MGKKTTPAKTEKVKKPAKVQKTVTVKKLPGLLKKAYTKESLDKKIYQKIYIVSDKILIESLFKDDQKSKNTKEKKYCIPLDTQLTKEQVRHLKIVAKDIKRQKGRIKAASFIAVAAVIAAIGITVTVFKNPVMKLAIRSAMQGAFGAKCDIGRVNVQIFGASIEVDNLAQANKDYPMKNIFQTDKILLDFNLAQLLRGRFDAKNLEVTGVQLGTDRTVSGKLPSKAKKEKEEGSKDENGFVKALKERSAIALSNAKNTFGSTVDVSNPEAALESAKSKFKSPVAAKEAEEKMNMLIPAWKERSASVESSAALFKESAEKLSKINVNSLKTAAEIQSAIEQIDSAMKNGDAAKKSFDDASFSLKTDTETVKNLKSSLDDAIAADKDTINSAVGAAKSFASGGAKKILGNYVDSAACTMLGSYYPYFKKGVSYFGSMKHLSSASTKKIDKTKIKKQGRRLYGRDIYWKKDTIPKFLIEHALATGTGFTAEAENISNDMDKRGKPMTAHGSFSIKNIVHNANFVVDARSTSTDPLITAQYSGSNYPVFLDLSKKIVASGVPSFSGTSTISAKMTADSDYSFALNGNMVMNPVAITAAEFTPVTMSSMYQKAISSIKTMSVGGTIGFSPDKGMDLDLTTDADKQIIAALSSAASGALSEAQEKAKAKALEELSAQTSGASDKIAQFTGIQLSISSIGSSITGMNSSLESKKKELQKELEKQAKSKASSAGKDAASSVLKKLF